MYKSSLPPPHPSLPHQPVSSSSNTPHNYPGYYNSHYVQAYSQPPPSDDYVNNRQNHNFNSTIEGSSSRRVTSQPIWYQAGNNRCLHPGCKFTGSHKTVEIHMMDRHLIYPPGWENRKKKSDWDADPSLKGKPIPIQGTNILLDSPQVLEAWIAERKMRFPTAAHIQDKKRKFEEALARGQLDLPDSGRPTKHRHIQNSGRGTTSNHTNTRQRHSSGRGNERQRVLDSGWPQKRKGRELVQETKPVVSIPSDSGSDSSDDGGNEPDSLSSKHLPSPQWSFNDQVAEQTPKKEIMSKSVPRHAEGSKNPQTHPRLPPKNPFASRPTLLRNLLLPEIRITVSNLSQVIRFLVDNDFLRNVELKPGQAIETSGMQVIHCSGNTQEDIS